MNITITLDDNINNTYVNKLIKYEDLNRQVKQMFELDNVSIFPTLISTNVLVI